MMKPFGKIASLVALAAAVTLPLTASAKIEPYPLEYFALREVVSNVTVSPDAKHVAMLKILTREGNPILHIYDADDMDKDPFVVNSDPMEIRSYEWVSDKHLLMSLRQKVRDKIEGQNQGVYEERITILDIEKEDFDSFDMPMPVVENVLPNDPNKIIVSMQPGLDDDPGLREAFRPRAYYKVDLERGTRELLIRGRLDMGQIEFDADGDPQFARGYDAGKGEYVFYYRPKGGKGWDDIYRVSVDDFHIWMEDPVIAPDPAVPGNVLMKTFNGDDKLGLWSYNASKKQFEELLYRRSDVDVYGVRYHSNSWTHPDQVVAVSYFKDNFHFEYFDEVEGGAYRQLEQLIPNAHYVSITSRSRDGNSLVARNIGPKDPGTYYLLHNGEFKAVGSQQPLLEPEKLAELEYFEYEARDGKKLAGFLTIPNSEPPYPTVVLPHGGPHVLEVVLYDEWAQVLANNGYLVVQPQYRMSHGYGFDHFASAFLENGSQAGRKMQDDKDDAALYLVEQGLADPDRIAMFGWSYGGYAALIAASRTPQIYQCVIAGAAVTDYVRQANEYGPRAIGTGKFWREVYEFGAVQPVDEVPKVNVPILLIHGSVDQRVRPRQAKLYLSQLDKYNKDYKYVELDGADHFYSTLFYDHQLTLYENLISYLKNDCGPGGL